MKELRLSDGVIACLEMRKKRLSTKQKVALMSGHSRRARELDTSITDIEMVLEGADTDD